MVENLMDDEGTATTSQQSSPVLVPESSVSPDTAHAHKRSLPPPAGPRSPRRRGSSHTRFNLSPTIMGSDTVAPPSGSSTLQSDVSQLMSFPVDAATNVNVVPVATPRTDMEVLPEYEYRSPEAVVEHIEEPSRSTLPPGVLAEHFADDDDLRPLWNRSGYKRNTSPQDPSTLMDLDFPASFSDGPIALPTDVPDRPQIGPGVMPKRWLENLHPHKLWQPFINELPRPHVGKTPPSRSSSLAVGPDDPPVPAPTEPVLESEPLTLDEVWAALPGGLEHHSDWYFCPDCWGWFHIVVGDGKPPIATMDEWEAKTKDTFDTPDDFVKAHTERMRLTTRLSDIDQSRVRALQSQLHLHEFPGLIESTTETRIERIEVEGHTGFPPLDPNAYGQPPPELTEYAKPTQDGTMLYVSCASDVWVAVDKGPIPGQLPPGLVKRFTHEKVENPNVGMTGTQSVTEAWNLVVTLIQNPLFRGKRGWVKMENQTFRNKIGASLHSSHLLYQMGFGCREEPEGYRVGPFTKGDVISDADVEQMDRYLVRTWIEVCLFLESYRLENRLPPVASEFVHAKTFGAIVDDRLQLSKIPELSIPFEVNTFKKDLARLGVMCRDTVRTVEEAYDMQVSCDHKNTAVYLGSLEKLARAHVPGNEQLQIKVATERSLDRYTEEDIQTAYARIGLTAEYVSSVMIELDDFPSDQILKMHREEMDRASDPTSRSDVSRALVIIGKERGDQQMITLGRTNGVYLSLDQAYTEFNLSRDSNIDDEMLILQYETWISDRPSRHDHYRMALSIIANAEGEERPVLQAFLQGKDISELQPPARRDLPAGLRNIGNTCYLNSVLQFLYAIKPVRDAVISFDATEAEPPSADETEKEMEKRVKVQSSQRFVKLLGELFSDMYSTSSSAVVPREELARLAILPIDVISERRDAIPVPKSRVTIDSLPIILSPDTSVTSSGVATAANSGPPSPLSSPPPFPPVKPSEEPISPISPKRPSILGKRASQDRDSAFGGSEERLRRLTDTEDLIELDSESTTPQRSNTDVDMDPPTREDSEVPSAVDLSQLELASPLTEGPKPLVDTGIATPGPTPEPAQKPAGPPPPLPPRRRSMALVAAEKFGLQQDAAEILINVLAQLECAFEVPPIDGRPQPNLISNLFSAKFQQQMLLESADGGVETHAPVESVFVHPIIGVEEDGKDLYDCLAELYLGGAEIEYAGQKGFKMDLINELPPMLYIQMRRSQYDPVKRSQTKTNTHVPFDRTLSMDRFLASADAAKRERSIKLTRDMMRMRAKRHELKNHKPMSIPDTYRFVRDALISDSTMKALSSPEQADEMSYLASDLSPDLFEALANEATDIEREIASLDESLPAVKTELEALWADSSNVEYELVSVFVHGGTGTGGHYWTYQADLPRDGNKFFYYSDEKVKDVPATDVFSDKAAQGVSPALLCYVRKDCSVVDTLHRAEEQEAVDSSAFDTGVASPADDTQVTVLPASEAMDTQGW